MKSLKIYTCPAVIIALAVTFQSCKSKKLIAKPAPPVAQAPAPAPTPAPAPPAPAPAPAPAPKPDYNFTNIQFDFDSSILQTSAIQYLDHVASEMKMDPSAKFMLNGYASIEGTAAHNMQLSIDRANSVKSYLVNAGIDVNNLTIKGYGTADPVASNSTEQGRILNRRVEIKLEQ